MEPRSFSGVASRVDRTNRNPPPRLFSHRKQQLELVHIARQQAAHFAHVAVGVRQGGDVNQHTAQEGSRFR
jgi:hypothetical protein